MAGVGPLVPPQVGGLSRGSFNSPLSCARRSLARQAVLGPGFRSPIWVIITPDADLYIEDISSQSAEVSSWRLYDPAGPIPYGINPANVHPCTKVPDAAGRSAPGGGAGVAAAGGAADAECQNFEQDETGLRFKEFRAAVTESKATGPGRLLVPAQSSTS